MQRMPLSLLILVEDSIQFLYQLVVFTGLFIKVLKVFSQTNKILCRSDFYGDELGWGAAWLLRATNDQFYKTRLDSLWNEFNYQDLSPKEFSWYVKI